MIPFLPAVSVTIRSHSSGVLKGRTARNLIRSSADRSHGRGEDDHVVDAERIHRAAGECHVTVYAGVVDFFAQAVLVRDAAAHALVAQSEIAVEAIRRRADAVALEVPGLVADDWIVDELHDLAPRHGLDM